MPVRVLQHGFAPTIDKFNLEPGAWKDIPIHAQFLIDLEFLTRYTSPSGASCIYSRSPPYLKEIASQFPWVHFYAYDYTEPNHDTEYDPERPKILCDVPLKIQVRNNTTTAAMELTNTIARRLGENCGNCNRVMICHESTQSRQLCLQVLLRPTYSLLEIQGSVPTDYPEGEIILPIFIPKNKTFALLVVPQEAGCKEYNPSLFQAEIGASLCLPLLYASY